MQIIKQQIGQTGRGETRFAFGFSGSAVELENLEISLVNHGMIEHAMLDLGAPEIFRYIIATERTLARYFLLRERAGVLSRDARWVEMGADKFASHLARRSQAEMDCITPETFLRYGEETAGETYSVSSELSEIN